MPKISEDLVQIRKAKRLSRQDVYYKCRLPIETIEAIEDGSIFSGTTQNKTYLRSYFRTYAKAVGIKDADMVNALDEHEIGTYKESLYKVYLTGDGDSGDSAGETGSENTKEQVDEDSESQQSEKETPKKSKTITPESQEKTISDVEWEDKSLKKPLSTSTSISEPPSSGIPSPPAGGTTETPDLKNIDWASRVKSAVYKPQRNRLFWVILAILLALAIAAGSIYWFWQPEEDPLTSILTAEQSDQTVEEPQNNAGLQTDALQEQSESDAESGSTAETSPSDQVENASGSEAAMEPDAPGQDVPQGGGISDSDELSANEPSPTETSNETVGELDMPVEEQGAENTVNGATDETHISSVLISDSIEEDTLYIYAYALHGNLEPIRVHSDLFTAEDNGSLPLRPYWVEQGQLMRFDFTDEIIFQGTLSRMVLIFNGNLIEDFNQFYLDGTRVRLTRGALLDNNRFSEPESDIFENLPHPVSIVDRPRFSP